MDQKSKERLLNINGLEFVVFIRSASVFIRRLLVGLICGKIVFLLLLAIRGVSFYQFCILTFLPWSYLYSFSFCYLISLLILISYLIFSKLDSFSIQQGLSLLLKSTSSRSLLFSNLMCSISISMLVAWLLFLGVIAAALYYIMLATVSSYGISKIFFDSIFSTIWASCLSFVAFRIRLYAF